MMTEDCEGASDVSASWSFLNHKLGQNATEIMTRTPQLHRFFFQLDVQYSASSSLDHQSCNKCVLSCFGSAVNVCLCKYSVFSVCFIKNDPLVILNVF